MLFLSDVNFLKLSEKVQVSNNSPWKYSKALCHLMIKIKIMFDQIHETKKNHKPLSKIIRQLGTDLFP